MIAGGEWFRKMLSIRGELGLTLEELVKGDLRLFLKAKEDLLSEDYPALPFTFIVRVILSGSYFKSRVLENFDNDLKSLFKDTRVNGIADKISLYGGRELFVIEYSREGGASLNSS